MKEEYKSAIYEIIKANRVYNKMNPLNKKKVEDAQYDLKFDKTKQSWEITGKTKCTKLDKIVKNIIVILESPHIDEFKGKEWLPLKKDEDFIKYFSDLYIKSKISNNLIKENEYKIYLLNAIQYQCSLGKTTSYFRDYVFLYYWEKKKKNFKKRLKNFFNDETEAVINLCTKGDHSRIIELYNKNTKKYEVVPKKCDNNFFKVLGVNDVQNENNLNDLVGVVIKDVIKDGVKYTTGTHPSCWWSSNRKIY